MQVVLITGGNSGIGYHIGICLQQQGCVVYEMSRREGRPPLNHIRGDVTKPEDCSAAVDRILQEQGRLDILINNAGMGISGAVEFTTYEDTHRQMEVNFFGVVNMNQAVLPILRKQRYGKIIHISSVAAPIPIPFQSFYSASKAAIRAYALALSQEVKSFGIEVSVVLPGDIATGFTDARRKSAVGDDIYQGKITRSVAGMERDERAGISAEKAGQFVASLALRKKLPMETVLGGKYCFFVLLSRLLPTDVLMKIVGLLYAR